MRAGMVALAARQQRGEKTGDSTPVLRALRQEAAPCRSLSATLKPIEPDTSGPDQWAEFDSANPLDRLL
jgi:hypothetical protein